MKTSIQTRWKKNLQFDSQVDGHSITTDATDADGGDDSGASPKKLMLAALSGCTGVDVAMILKKMRVDYDDLVITVDAEQTDETPAQYTAMHMTYEFSGKDLDPDKLKKAIVLSQEKYCGVSMMYKKIMDLTWEIKCRD